MRTYEFRKMVYYSVEAENMREALALRDGLENSVKDTIKDEIYDREDVYSGDWETWIETEEPVYVLTDKGRDYLDALNGKANFDEANYDKNGKRISYPTIDLEYDDFADLEDEFFDYLDEDNEDDFYNHITSDEE